MSETVETKERDLLDGGFAVVDRERIIEEETREITPWYKHVINCFIAPSKVVEEKLLQDPPTGLGMGVILTLFFTEIMLLMTYANSVVKEAMYNSYRTMGIEENMMAQKYSLDTIVGMLTGGCGVFIGLLFTTLILKIIVSLYKVKCKYSVLYTLSLLMSCISSAVLVVEALLKNLMGVNRSIFTIGIMFDEMALATNGLLAILCSVLSLGTILQYIYMIIGLSLVGHISKKKATLVYGTFIVVSLGFGLLMSSLAPGM